MGKKQNSEIKEESIQNISLSEAILAPLISIFKAQIHSARAFLSYLLQISTPHLEVNPDGTIKDDAQQKKANIYTQDFRFEKEINGQKQIVEIKIPTLSLVPIMPLGIEEGEFEFYFHIEDYHLHRQMQKSEEDSLKKDAYDRYNRPWYLVDRPINFTGNVNPTSSESSTSKESIMKIRIKLAKQPIPAGLDKLLVTFNQMTDISTELNKENNQ